MISFIVTSTINASFSKYDPETRLVQTLDTIQSIRDRIPNAHITILESSILPLSERATQSLSAKTNRFIAFGQNSTIINIATKLDNPDVVKNMSEMVMLHMYFKLAINNGWLEDVERIFKISGRYRLNDSFDLSHHSTGWTVGKAEKSQFHTSTTGNIDFQYMLRLYSLSAAEATGFCKILKQMMTYMSDRINAGSYVDVEHLFYKFLPHDKIETIDPMGIEGFVAPTGQWISN